MELQFPASPGTRGIARSCGRNQGPSFIQLDLGLEFRLRKVAGGRDGETAVKWERVGSVTRDEAIGAISTRRCGAVDVVRRNVRRVSL